MINKQQGGANLQAFGGGAQGNLMGIGGMGSGVGMGGMMGAPDEPAPGFDLNEFPSLGGPPLPNARGPGAQFGHGVGGGLGMGPGPQMGGMFGGMDGMGSADGYGVVALQKPHPEFTIQNEDFPALPGAPRGRGRRAQAGRRQGRPIRPAGGTSRPCLAAVPGRSRVSAEAWGRKDPAAGSVSTSGAGISGRMAADPSASRRAGSAGSTPRCTPRAPARLRRRLRLRRRWGRGNAFGFLGGEGRGSA